MLDLSLPPDLLPILSWLELRHSRVAARVHQAGEVDPERAARLLAGLVATHRAATRTARRERSEV